MTGTDARPDGHPWRDPDPEQASAPGTSAQWFGFLGGMTAYAVHLMAGIMLVPLACRIGAVWPITSLTVVVGLVIIASTWVAWSVRRTTVREAEADEPAVDEPVRASAERQVGGAAEDPVDPPGSVRIGPNRRALYLGNLGLLLNPLALAIVLATEVNVHVYDPCLPG